jgi:hypothetical protein
VILSRFWYVVLALALGGSLFVLWTGAAVYNRAGQRAVNEALSADSSAVGWFLRDDASSRASALIPVALNADVRGGLAKATSEDKPSRENAEKTLTALRKLAKEVDPELAFDVLWAVDANGRVIATVGDVVAAGEDWELGGYSLVADALHGWIRDDAWVWKGRVLRVVARPVEQEVNAEPVGAVVGGKLVDDRFATAVSKRTGAAIGFYAEGARVASAAPEGFDKASLDAITQDIKLVEESKDYKEKGRSEPRVLNAHLGVVYARLPGEAWDLGAGYAVGRVADSVETPLAFLDKASDDDKARVPTSLVLAIVLGAIVLGLGFTIFEHTKPLRIFCAEAADLAAGKIDHLAPSKLGGVYRKIASDVNDGIEKVVVKGGGARRAADLQQVLGPIPNQPSMSAFAVPGPGAAPASAEAKPLPTSPEPKTAPAAVAPKPAAPAPKPQPKPEPAPSDDARGSIPMSDDAAVSEPERPPAKPKASGTFERTLASPSPGVKDDGDEMSEWRRVYEEFLGVKRQCGEPTSTLTFEKFKGTLERNKAALVARHHCERVKFTVYVKDGKAALKASPIK